MIEDFDAVSDDMPREACNWFNAFDELITLEVILLVETDCGTSC